jgi:hypothetical protein
MTFHTQVVGANGQRQAMFIERSRRLFERAHSEHARRLARAIDQQGGG